MTANPLLSQSNALRNGAPSDPDERRQFWLNHGNQSLWSQGRGDLEWAWDNGSYYIRQRA